MLFSLQSVGIYFLSKIIHWGNLPCPSSWVILLFLKWIIISDCVPVKQAADLLIDISRDMKLIHFECSLRTLEMNSSILGVILLSKISKWIAVQKVSVTKVRLELGVSFQTRSGYECSCVGSRVDWTLSKHFRFPPANSSQPPVFSPLGWCETLVS